MMRKNLRYLLAPVVLSLVLLCGCEKNAHYTGDILSAARCGDYFAVVFEYGYSYLLVVTDAKGRYVDHAEVEDGSVSAIESNEGEQLLLCVLSDRGVGTVSAVLPGDLSQVRFRSKYPSYALSGPFYLASAEGKWVVAKLSASLSEEVVCSADSDIIAFSADADRWRLTGSMMAVEALGNKKFVRDSATRTAHYWAPAAKGVRARSSAPRKRQLGETDFEARVICYDRHMGAAPVLSGLTWTRGMRLMEQAVQGTFTVGMPGEWKNYSYTVDNEGGKLEASAQEVECPFSKAFSVHYEQDSVIYSDGSWVTRHTPDGAKRLFMVHPFERAGILGDGLYAFKPHGIPARYCASVFDRPPGKAGVGYEWKLGTRYLADDLRDHLNAMGEFSVAAGVPYLSAADIEPVQAQSPEQKPWRGLLPVAEYALARGKLKRARAYYEDRGEGGLLRRAEIALFFEDDVQAARELFASVGDIKQRKRVDLYLKLLECRGKSAPKLNDQYYRSYADAMRLVTTRDVRGFLSTVQKYVLHCDVQHFDPYLFDKVLRLSEHYEFSGDDNTTQVFRSRVLDVLRQAAAGDGAYSISAAMLLAEHYMAKGECSRALESLALTGQLAMDAPLDAEVAQVLKRLAQSTFALGEGTEAAHKSVQRLLGTKMGREDALRAGLWSLALASVYGAGNMSTEMAVALPSWTDDERLALEAAYWAITLSDIADPTRSNIVLDNLLRQRLARGAVQRTDIAAVGFMSGVMRLSDEEISGELPGWFITRMRTIAGVTEVRALLGDNWVDLVITGRGTEVANGLPTVALSTLGSSVADFAVVRSYLTEDGERLRRMLELRLRFAPPVGIQSAYYLTGEVMAALEIPQIGCFVARHCCDVRCIPFTDEFSLMTGSDFYARFSREVSHGLPKGRYSDFAYAAAYGDIDAMSSYLVSGFFAFGLVRPTALMLEARGESKRALDLLSSVGDVQSMIGPISINESCELMVRTGRTERLETFAKFLVERADLRITFDDTARYALIFANEAKDEEEKLKWHVKFLERGGLITFSDEEVAEYVAANREAFHEWSKSYTFAVALFISSRTDGELREQLLDACGDMRQKVEEELKGLEGD